MVGISVASVIETTGVLYQLANRHLLKSQTSFKLFDWFLVIK